MEHMRIWTEVDVAEVAEHIIIADDKFGFCPGCREIGIKVEGAAQCPKCARTFRYITARESRGGRHEIVARLRRKAPALVFVDYDDYERLTGKQKAQSLFKDI